MKHIYILLEYYICHFNSVNNVEREIHGNKFLKLLIVIFFWWEDRLVGGFCLLHCALMSFSKSSAQQVKNVFNKFSGVQKLFIFQYLWFIHSSFFKLKVHLKSIVKLFLKHKTQVLCHETGVLQSCSVVNGFTSWVISFYTTLQEMRELNKIKT